MKHYNLLFLDLTGTVIDTISGENSPLGVWDMRINLHSLDKIIGLNPRVIILVSNQDGIANGSINKRDFEFMMEYLLRAIRTYFHSKGFNPSLVEYIYCPFNNPSNNFYLPNTGMLEKALSKWSDYKRQDCLMVQGNNIETAIAAENFGCDCQTIWNI